jgi:hypothetical protein
VKIHQGNFQGHLCTTRFFEELIYKLAQYFHLPTVRFNTTFIRLGSPGGPSNFNHTPDRRATCHYPFGSHFDQ